MDDTELDQQLKLAAKGDKQAGNLALAEIATRLLKLQRLSANAVAALCSVLVGQLEAGKGGRFLFPNAKPDKRPVGRPRGAKKKSTLWQGLTRYGAAQGLIPEDRHPVSPRQLQRDRAIIRGAPGKPGRPPKPDKK